MQTKTIIKSIILFLWILTIFSFSIQKGVQTTSTSQGFTKTIVSIYLKITNNYNEDNLNKTIKDIHPIIRKLAHYTEFFILAILTILLIKDFNIKYKYLYGIIFCIMIAISDETIQFFIDGRVSSIKDVLIDISGSLSYILIYYLIKKVK